MKRCKFFWNGSCKSGIRTTCFFDKIDQETCDLIHEINEEEIKKTLILYLTESIQKVKMNDFLYNNNIDSKHDKYIFDLKKTAKVIIP